MSTNNTLSIAEKIELIRKDLENTYNGRVFMRAAINDPRQICVTLHIRYSTNQYTYLVAEEAIEISDYNDIAIELHNVFDTLIWQHVRRF